MPTPRLKDSVQSFIASLKLWWQDWSNQVLVAILATLLSLTILLSGPAYFGVLNQGRELTHGYRTGLPGFWEGFRAYFWKGIFWGLASLGLLAPFGLGIYYFLTRKSEFSLAGLLLLSFVGFLIYLLSMLTAACTLLQEVPDLWLGLKNAVALLRLYPGLMLGFGAISLILTLLSLRYYLPIFLGVEALLALYSLITVQRTLGITPENLATPGKIENQ